MKDWEAFKLIGELIETLNHSAPVEFTLDAADGWFDATNDARRKLLEARKPFEDRLYAEYVSKGQRPWCDVCGHMVAAYASGWEHYYKDGVKPDSWIAPHEISTKGYHWGWEALIEKRLRFEI